MTLSSSDAGRELAAARRPKDKHCAVCGKAFVTVGRGVYCANACRQRAKMARKRAASSGDC
ncbi:MAG: DUF2116 family Zn-ribbon domain-containing protein [Candidatus Competibacter sp.]|nr:DUF2116 family Zn-ribbon domain-containing protein [Candidatus Competibacter sp.]MDS4058351.1 DUF2116 family Zn-ribbon domain-containing protein [Candidatus Contendobacter sp.]HRD50902.1 DUF2116 family Zn-ribbon domain-containing protein [Candidatus Contendobacter sp.]